MLLLEATARLTCIHTCCPLTCARATKPASQQHGGTTLSCSALPCLPSLPHHPPQSWEPAHKALPSRRLVSGSRDQTVRVWDAATRRCQYTMSSHTMVVTCVRWGGEGLVYSASRDCCINVWSADEGKLVRTLKGHAHWVNTLALSTEAVLRAGAHDHTGRAPADPQEAMQVRWLVGD